VKKSENKGVLSLNAVMLLLKEIYYKEGKSIMFYSKRLDITYSHISKIAKQLTVLKLLLSIKSGRVVNLKLTEQGRKVAMACCVISMGFKGEPIGNIKTVSRTKEAMVSDPKRDV